MESLSIVSVPENGLPELLPMCDAELRYSHKKGLNMTKRKQNRIRRLTLTGLFLALGLVLPFLTGQIPLIGSMLLPMHLPVFLSALLCGFEYGAPMAFVLPLLRSTLFGMPPMYPTALAMSFELCTYALVSGYCYLHSRWQCTKTLYRSLLLAMLAGRLVWGLAQYILLGLNGKAFTMGAFLSAAFLRAIPGILIQLILIPAIMIALRRAKLTPLYAFGHSAGEGETAAERGE